MTDTPLYDALLVDRLRRARQALEHALELEQAVQAREQDLARREQLLEQSVLAGLAVAVRLADDQVRRAEAQALAAEADATARVEVAERRADLRVREVRAQVAVSTPPTYARQVPAPPAPAEPSATPTEPAREPRHFLSGFALPIRPTDPQRSAEDVADGVRRPVRALPGMDDLLQTSPKVGRHLDALFGGPEPD